MHQPPKLIPKPSIYSCFLEVDKNADAGYIHIFPYTHKLPGKVTRTEQIENKNNLIINFDWDGEKLVGIEILDISDRLDLE